MFLFNELSEIQRKTIVDLRQAYEAFHATRRNADRHYAGSMRWREKNGSEYLFRRIGKGERSLGRRDEHTDEVYAAFMAGRQRVKQRLSSLTASLDTHAALAKAAGLGRVPRIVARLLRKLDDANVLGHIRIVGTNSLFAYEALAGVTIAGDALATADVDLLLDARRRLRIMVPDEDERTVAGLVRRVDASFEIMDRTPYRMANDDGFMIDLIRPEPKPAWRKEPDAILKPGDLDPAPIEGLQWLVNVPSVETLVIDVNGYPAPIVVPEPRMWMAHKLWLSKRPMRDPVKARRDVGQAYLLRDLLVAELPQYPLDDGFFDALPRPLREVAGSLRPRETVEEDDSDDLPQPRW
ncbi:hypothetical protein N825_20895 [Skermanella stibiiresistens SB22]|uniref:Nucleotidyltransferase-like domain-containing protein n=1 Tax=Skermanella stibiiresistens SB22 TaxID=1385369 RepID=W9GXX4_9PROT|nr:nucleotidyltransferase domain-containing protein [Skermanella stibiiresistens]EWY37297.1 hypothetical protein N825_20895 [Skermanella stibiiresistens SB22]